MKIAYTDKVKLIHAARGKIESDFAFSNAKVLNVFTGEVLDANVYIYENAIAHVDYECLPIENCKKVIELSGKYLVPGFIDAHMHVESTMMTPRNFAKAALVWGSTTVVTDPHEVANVVGVEGVVYMHDSGNDLPMRQFVDIPSCVPSVPGLENAGADFFRKEIEELSGLDRVIGLAEVMDYFGVADGEDRMMEIIDAAEKKGLYIQGHIPSPENRVLSAYLCGGPTTCHETRGSEEALNKIRKGLYLDARESSMSKNMKTIWDGVKDMRYFDRVCFCTDDVNAGDILHHGHMNHVIQSAIDVGMNPIDAIRCATLNVAKEVSIDNLGAIAPGYIADMVVLDSLEVIKPTQVYYGGRLVAENGVLVEEIKDESFPLEKKNTVFIKDLTAKDLTIVAPIDNGKVKVNVLSYMEYKTALSDIEEIEVEVKDGNIVLPEDVMFVAVVNRHSGNDNVGLGLVKKFGNNHGSVASTVSHDCHNLTIVYDNPEDAVIAINELKRVGGGFTSVYNGEILHTLALPICGLMSDKEAKDLAVDCQKMAEVNCTLGLDRTLSPLMRIVTLALIVIPNAKMSDLGLIHVTEKRIVPLFVD